jgi:hypothetical protein
VHGRPQTAPRPPTPIKGRPAADSLTRGPRVASAAHRPASPAHALRKSQGHGLRQCPPCPPPINRHPRHRSVPVPGMRGWLLRNLREALHIELQVWCNLGLCRRLRSWCSQPLESRRLAGRGHGNRLPPHHFPNNKPTNPRTDRHTVAVSKPLDGIDHRLRKPHRHGGTQAPTSSPVCLTCRNLVFRICVELLCLSRVHAVTLSLVGTVCQGSPSPDRRRWASLSFG